MLDLQGLVFADMDFSANSAVALEAAPIGNERYR
jgi:hypothetical protein